MDSKYILLSASIPNGKPCQSHAGIQAEHLFGNTNWSMRQEDRVTFTFVCGRCGEVRVYRQLKEKTLL